MRTSGRGKSETLLYIAPAAIFAAIYIWMYGTPADAVTALDRMLVKGIRWAGDVASAVVQAITG